MRTIHFDPFSGTSGDMMLGTLADVGADLDAVREQLASILPFEFELTPQRVVRRGIAGTHVHVHVHEEHAHHRGLNDLLAILARGELPAAVRASSERTFRLLAEAEAAVHGTTPEAIHFHEVGAGDTLIDVIGTHLAIDQLGIARATSGPVAVGSGTVRCAHGELPVPAPATAELLRGVPLRATDATGELTTPTGAALLVTLCGEFRGLGGASYERVGYGFGTRDDGVLANALRSFLGAVAAHEADDEVAIIETTVDDMTGQMVAHLSRLLFAAGALDVTTTAVGMKKSRPGVVISVIGRVEDEPALARAILQHSTSFGVRVRRERRVVLERRVERVETPWGSVAVKIGSLDGEDVQASPEYEECASVAESSGIPLKHVLDAARAACGVLAGKGRRGC
jgi:uncharacterized protein (TIGR00299 family) protein